LAAGLEALVLAACLAGQAMAVVAAAALAVMVDTAPTALAGVVVAAPFQAVVFKTDLTTATGVVVRAAADALPGAAKSAIATTIDLPGRFGAAAWLAIIIDAKGAEVAVGVDAAWGAAEVVDAALTGAEAIGS
jgi:hypothetical protein